ncbi:hypothetical protein [Schlesneria paludicola]|uniref:hypothetical protein n=1 Tax=Schlesneria paludicola TaxID=360056 RepID=UPI00029B46DC|nr:hypothetical protein [Schlesneria paludicola]
MSDNPDSNRLDRRQFTKQLATLSGAATTALLSTSISKAEGHPPPSDPANPVDAPAEAKPERKDDGRERAVHPSEELLLLHLLVQRYPSERLDDAAIRGIFGEIRGDLVRGRVLSQFPLKNSDGPSPGFRAYRRAR